MTPTPAVVPHAFPVVVVPVNPASLLRWLNPIPAFANTLNRVDAEYCAPNRPAPPVPLVVDLDGVKVPWRPVTWIVELVRV